MTISSLPMLLTLLAVSAVSAASLISTPPLAPCDPAACINPIPIGGALSGTYAPGCYTSAAAFDLVGAIILKGVGSFTFVTQAALTTSGASVVLLAGGASCSAVNWCVAAAFTSGAASAFNGNVKAGAAVTLGGATALYGSVSSDIGVITYGDGATVVPCGPNLPCNCLNPVALTAELGGQTLPPGCYLSNAALGLTGTFTLSGAGSYSFSAPGAITTAASSIVKLTNGAACNKVNWCIGSAATTGASSVFVGNLYTQLAVTLGASSIVNGEIYNGKARTDGAAAQQVPCGGASSGLPNGGAGSGSSSGGGVAGCDCVNPTRIPAQLGGQVLAPGCYVAVGDAAFGLTGSLTLQGLGEFYLSTPAAINTAAASAVVLSGGAQCANVHWCSGAAGTLGASSKFVGELKTVAAITVGASAVVKGSLKAGNGVVTMGASSTVTPCTVTSIDSTSDSSSSSTSSNSNNRCGCANPISIPADLIGQSLGPGCYMAVANAAFANTGVFTMRGPGTYSFNTNAAMTTTASSSMQLLLGAQCQDISWCLGAALTTGASSLLIGNVYTVAAVTLGAQSVVRGEIVAGNGVITYGAGATNPPCNDLGSLATRVIATEASAAATNQWALVARTYNTLRGQDDRNVAAFDAVIRACPVNPSDAAGRRSIVFDSLRSVFTLVLPGEYLLESEVEAEWRRSFSASRVVDFGWLQANTNNNNIDGVAIIPLALRATTSDDGETHRPFLSWRLTVTPAMAPYRVLLGFQPASAFPAFDNFGEGWARVSYLGA